VDIRRDEPNRLLVRTTIFNDNDMSRVESSHGQDSSKKVGADDTCHLMARRSCSRSRAGVYGRRQSVGDRRKHETIEIADFV